MYAFGNFPDAKFNPLRGDAGDNPAFAAGGTAQFSLKTLPLLRWGTHAEKLLGILITFSGTSTFSGTTGGGTDRSMDHLKMALIADAEVSGCWHGTPVQQKTFTGINLTTIERLALAGHAATTEDIPVNGASGAGQTVEFGVWIPLFDARGEKGHHTALFSLCYKDAQLLINFAAAGKVKDNQNNTPALAGTIRATAVTIPESELMLGPAQDWQLFESVAQAGADQVILQGLADRTGLVGVEPGCALSDLLMLTAYGGNVVAAGGDDLGFETGAFSGDTLTQISCDFLAQPQTKDMRPFFAMLESLDQRPRARRVLTPALAAAGYLLDKSTFPYALNGGQVRGVASRAGAIAVALLTVGERMELTKLPTVEGTQFYNRTATVVGTKDKTLVHRYKRWSEAAKADLKAMLIQSGIVSAVLKGETNVDWETVPLRKNPVPAVKAAYLPQRLAPMNKDSALGR